MDHEVPPPQQHPPQHAQDGVARDSPFTERSISYAPQEMYSNHRLKYYVTQVIENIRRNFYHNFTYISDFIHDMGGRKPKIKKGSVNITAELYNSFFPRLPHSTSTVGMTSRHLFDLILSGWAPHPYHNERQVMAVGLAEKWTEEFFKVSKRRGDGLFTEARSNTKYGLSVSLRDKNFLDSFNFSSNVSPAHHEELPGILGEMESEGEEGEEAPAHNVPMRKAHHYMATLYPPNHIGVLDSPQKDYDFIDQFFVDSKIDLGASGKVPFGISSLTQSAAILNKQLYLDCEGLPDTTGGEWRPLGRDTTPPFPPDADPSPPSPPGPTQWGRDGVRVIDQGSEQHGKMDAQSLNAVDGNNFILDGLKPFSYDTLDFLFMNQNVKGVIDDIEPLPPLQRGLLRHNYPQHVPRSAPPRSPSNTLANKEKICDLFVHMANEYFHDVFRTLNVYNSTNIQSFYIEYNEHGKGEGEGEDEGGVWYLVFKLKEDEHNHYVIDITYRGITTYTYDLKSLHINKFTAEGGWEGGFRALPDFLAAKAIAAHDRFNILLFCNMACLTAKAFGDASYKIFIYTMSLYTLYKIGKEQNNVYPIKPIKNYLITQDRQLLMQLLKNAFITGEEWPKMLDAIGRLIDPQIYYKLTSKTKRYSLILGNNTFSAFNPNIHILPYVKMSFKPFNHEWTHNAKLLEDRYTPYFYNSYIIVYIYFIILNICCIKANSLIMENITVLITYIPLLNALRGLPLSFLIQEYNRTNKESAHLSARHRQAAMTSFQNVIDTSALFQEATREEQESLIRAWKDGLVKKDHWNGKLIANLIFKKLIESQRLGLEVISDIQRQLLRREMDIWDEITEKISKLFDKLVENSFLDYKLSDLFDAELLASISNFEEYCFAGRREDGSYNPDPPKALGGTTRGTGGTLAEEKTGARLKFYAYEHQWFNTTALRVSTDRGVVNEPMFAHTMTETIGKLGANDFGRTLPTLKVYYIALIRTFARLNNVGWGDQDIADIPNMLDYFLQHIFLEHLIKDEVRSECDDLREININIWRLCVINLIFFSDLYLEVYRFDLMCIIHCLIAQWSLLKDTNNLRGVPVDTMPLEVNFLEGASRNYFNRDGGTFWHRERGGAVDKFRRGDVEGTLFKNQKGICISESFWNLNEFERRTLEEANYASRGGGIWEDDPPPPQHITPDDPPPQHITADDPTKMCVRLSDDFVWDRNTFDAVKKLLSDILKEAKPLNYNFIILVLQFSHPEAFAFPISERGEVWTNTTLKEDIFSAFASQPPTPKDLRAALAQASPFPWDAQERKPNQVRGRAEASLQADEYSRMVLPQNERWYVLTLLCRNIIRECAVGSEKAEDPETGGGFNENMWPLIKFKLKLLKPDYVRSIIDHPYLLGATKSMLRTRIKNEVLAPGTEVGPPCFLYSNGTVWSKSVLLLKWFSVFSIKKSTDGTEFKDHLIDDFIKTLRSVKIFETGMLDGELFVKG